MAETELLDAEFSYEGIEKDDVDMLRHCENRLQKYKQAVAGGLMSIGETIAIAHDRLAKYGHGSFQKWVESKGGFSKSSAYNYMAAFKVFGVCPTVGQIENSAMYALSQKDTPEKAVKEVLRLTEKGANITQKQAKEIIKKYKDQEPEEDPEEEEEIEEEPEVVEEPTIEEICEEANKSIESFCRAIVKKFQEDVPKLPWTEDSGRIDSALASLKAGLTTLRGAKGEVCPACVEGQTEKGKCKYCKGHGYLPVYQARQIPEDARL